MIIISMNNMYIYIYHIPIFKWFHDFHVNVCGFNFTVPAQLAMTWWLPQLGWAAPQHFSQSPSCQGRCRRGVTEPDFEAINGHLNMLSISMLFKMKDQEAQKNSSIFRALFFWGGFGIPWFGSPIHPAKKSAGSGICAKTWHVHQLFR